MVSVLVWWASKNFKLFEQKRGEGISPLPDWLPLRQCFKLGFDPLGILAAP
jgi:hypothetical protein